MKKYAKEFTLSKAPQRSQIWFAERAGKPSSSGLDALFDTLKDGRTPSAKAKAYLKQLAFERKFGVTYDRFETKAMKEGVFYEDFAKMIYQKETNNKLEEAFSYISSWFISTPDAFVVEAVKGQGLAEGLASQRYQRGLLECKVVGDETFMDIMENGIPIGHELQTQSQLMASGLNWVDYIVVNVKTRAYFMFRVKRNNKLIQRIYERLHEPLQLPELNDNVKVFGENLLQDFLGGSTPDDTPSPIIKDLPF